MRPKLYGHRGARGERLENTIEGFLYAHSLGLGGIETDIAMTADLVPVLHHDAELPDGRLIKNVDFVDLPEGLPALEQALRAVPETEWLLEIKTYPPAPEKSHPAALMVEKTLAVLGAGRVCILAFDWAVLYAVAARAPWVRRVCLTAPDTAEARELWWGPGFAGRTIPQAVAATGADGWAGLHSAMTESESREARALGLEIFAWTVNDTGEFNRLAPLADGIITDYPSKFVSK
jgi:glycerophosphoryl diester phosphodiesterase